MPDRDGPAGAEGAADTAVVPEGDLPARIRPQGPGPAESKVTNRSLNVLPRSRFKTCSCPWICKSSWKCQANHAVVTTSFCHHDSKIWSFSEVSVVIVTEVSLPPWQYIWNGSDVRNSQCETELKCLWKTAFGLKPWLLKQSEYVKWKSRTTQQPSLPTSNHDFDGCSYITPTYIHLSQFPQSIYK